MTLQHTILVVAGSVITLWLVCSNIRKKRLMMSDAISWVVLSVALLILALFPNIAIEASRLLGFISPINLVYLCVIAILLLKLFRVSCKISMLSNRVNELAQEVALARRESDEQLKEHAQKISGNAQQKE